MPTVLNRCFEGIGAALLLQLLAMMFVDRAQFKSRLVGLLGYRGKVRVLWNGPATSRTFWILFLPWQALSVLTPSPAHPHAPWQLWQKVALGLFVAIVLSGAIFATRRLKRWQRCAGTSLVSRGEVFDRIRKIVRQSNDFKWFDPQVYVYPDLAQAQWFAWNGTTILLPRPLLDCMSRREIDALAARQLCRQWKQYWAPPFWTLLACNAAAVGLAVWLLPGMAARVAVLAPLLAIQFAVLARYLPRALARADFRAAELTGDSEAFLSSMAGLARFTGTPLDEEAIREIAGQGGVPAERIPELLKERTVPAEQRYSTSGAYMVAGLA